MLIFHSDGYGEREGDVKESNVAGRGGTYMPADSKDVGERAEHAVQRGQHG